MRRSAIRGVYRFRFRMSSRSCCESGGSTPTATKARPPLLPPSVYNASRGQKQRSAKGRTNYLRSSFLAQARKIVIG